MSIGRFQNEEHRNQRAILFCYKFQRRRGYGRTEALQRALTQRARMKGLFAVMEASDWKANPNRIAAQASQVSV